MNYYAFNINDYHSATRHLTIIEDIAYRRLLDEYYRTEHPLDLDVKTLARRVCMVPKKDVVATVLREFFQEGPEGWYHGRCAKEIAKYHAKAQLGSENAKKRYSKPQTAAESNQEASERKKVAWAGSCHGTAIALQMQPSGTADGCESYANQEPGTKNQEPETKNQQKETSKQHIGIYIPNSTSSVLARGKESQQHQKLRADALAHPLPGEGGIQQLRDDALAWVLAELAKFQRVRFRKSKELAPRLQKAKSQKEITEIAFNAALIAEFKSACWVGTDFERHLKPGTLWSSEHWDDYLAEAESWRDQGKPRAKWRKQSSKEVAQGALELLKQLDMEGP